MPSPLLMSLSEIAAFARVRRPVVTTWRRRHPGFPAPVATDGGQPRFDGQAVCDWLVATGRAERDRLEPDLRMHTLAVLGEGIGTAPLVAVATSLLCLHHIDGEPLTEATASDIQRRAQAADRDDLILRSEITDNPELALRLAPTVDELIEAAWGVRPAFERVLGLPARLGAPDPDGLHPLVVRLIAALADAKGIAELAGSLVIADPAAGRGDLLLETIGQLGEEHAPTVLAAEPDDDRARLLRRRLCVHDIADGDRLVRSTPDDTVAPDVLVTALPYQAAENRSAVEALTAVDAAALSLAPGSVAVVLGPAQALSGDVGQFTNAERLRANLLDHGMVEAVIRLPGGMMPARPGYETALWVCAATARVSHQGWVLLADLSDRKLSTGLIDTCVADVVGWRWGGRRPGAHTPTICVPTPVARLVERPGPLTPHQVPSAWERTTVVPRTVARVTELEADLAQHARPDTASRLPVVSGLAAATPGERSRVAVGTLVRRHWLAIGQGHRINKGDIIADGDHRVLGSAELIDPRLAGSRALDREVLATRYPRVVLTEPGDVLVTLAPEPAVRLDTQGYSVLEFPVRRLRVRPDGKDQFPPRVLAALLEAAVRSRASGAVRASRKLDEWELPILPPHTVQGWDAMLAATAERRRQARAELHALDELERIAAAGIANATLDFPR